MRLLKVNNSNEVQDFITNREVCGINTPGSSKAVIQLHRLIIVCGLTTFQSGSVFLCTEVDDSNDPKIYVDSVFCLSDVFRPVVIAASFVSTRHRSNAKVQQFDTKKNQDAEELARIEFYKHYSISNTELSIQAIIIGSEIHALYKVRTWQ
jgi:hypothetical protein